MGKHGFARLFFLSIGLAALFGIGCSGNSAAPTRTGQQYSALNPVTSADSNAPVNWFVSAGMSDLNQATQALGFFARIITIDAGDSITWSVGGNAHTVTFFAHRKTPKLPITARFGGTTYDGSVYTSSGFITDGNTYTLTFPKIGVFPYSCLFHGPEMAGYVVVQPKGSVYPHTQAYYTQRGDDEADGILKRAFASLQQFPFPSGGTKFAAGISPDLFSGNTRSVVLRFINSDDLGPGSSSDAITVPVGSTITWVDESSNEPHTVTFPIAGQTPPPNFDPFHPPIGGHTYDGEHFVHSGPLFPSQSFSLKFTERGTFLYYCIFHDAFGMIGKVTVN